MLEALREEWSVCGFESQRTGVRNKIGQNWEYFKEKIRGAGCVMRDSGCGLRDARCGMQDAGYEMRVVGCEMRDARCGDTVIS